jgi:hypothetical protein
MRGMGRLANQTSAHLLKGSFTVLRYPQLMDLGESPQNRRGPRSNMQMTASMELSGSSVPVTVRNLSAQGALIEADRLPVEGTELVFRKDELSARGQIIWVNGRHAGISFVEPLCPDAVLRHMPMPRARTMPHLRSAGLSAKTLTVADRMYGTDWVSVD